MATVAQVLQIALGYQRAGAVDDAIRLYDRILDAAPDHADTLFLAATAHRQAGRPGAALDALDRLRRARPGFAAAARLRAAIHAAAPSPDRIVRSAVDRALALDPAEPDTWRLAADLAAAAGQTGGAVTLYDRAVGLLPAVAALHLARAVALHRAGHLAASGTGLRRGLTLAPLLVPAATVLADVEERLGRPLAAAALWHRIAMLDPSQAAAWQQVGRLRLDGVPPGSGVGAAPAARRALALDPAAPDLMMLAARAMEADHLLSDAAAVLAGATAMAPADLVTRMALGRLLFRTERMDAARRTFVRAAALAPDRAEPPTNAGTVEHLQWNAARALRLFDLALRLDPAMPEAHANYGNFEIWRGRPEPAIPVLRRAVALDPANPDYGFNLSLALKRCARLAEGNRLYERGLESGVRGTPQRRGLPVWHGEDLAGRTLLIEDEQGIGDELRFASFFPDAIAAAGHCIVECEERLVGLFRRSFPEATVRPWRLHPPDVRETAADCTITAGSLALHFRPDIASYPDRIGYLVPDPDRVAAWHRRLAPLGPGLRVGICWRSGLIKTNRLIDITSIEQWSDVLRLDGIHFVKLQYDRAEEELARVRRDLGVVIHDWPEIDLRNDLEEAAALSAAVDVVATVGVSVSDMAGAVGTETLVLWHGLKSELGVPFDPVYPRHTLLFRRHDDPISVSIEQLVARLRERVSRGPRGDPPG